MQHTETIDIAFNYYAFSGAFLEYKCLHLRQSSHNIISIFNLSGRLVAYEYHISDR